VSLCRGLKGAGPGTRIDDVYYAPVTGGTFQGPKDETTGHWHFFDCSFDLRDSVSCRMNWEAITALAEILGVIVVAVSLVYLSIQIRQNTKVARAATRHAIAVSTENLGSDLINNRDMAEIFVKHMNGQELSPVENLRLQSRCYRDMAHWENIHYQFTEGMVTEDQWLGFRKNLAALLTIDVYREYWAHESFHYSDAFRTEVESIRMDVEPDSSAADFVSRFVQGDSR